jgi:hypothetical protein
MRNSPTAAEDGRQIESIPEALLARSRERVWRRCGRADPFGLEARPPRQSRIERLAGELAADAVRAPHHSAGVADGG